jgi:hypothetical protein
VFLLSYLRHPFNPWLLESFGFGLKPSLRNRRKPSRGVECFAVESGQDPGVGAILTSLRWTASLHILRFVLWSVANIFFGFLFFDNAVTEK